MKKSNGAKYKRIIIDEFYSCGLLQAKYLNRFSYRGKGRPRLIDYASLDIIERDLTVELNKYLDSKKE